MTQIREIKEIKVNAKKYIRDEWSTKVFDSQPVDIHGCDTFFNTIRVVAQ